ncbi:mCG147139 [Mus musculus]|nr:mCG147139 [Mus musculus]
MVTAAPEAEAISRARRTPVLWSGWWPVVCGPPRLLPQRLCASARPRSCPVLWRTL